MVQGVWAGILALSGSFDQLTDLAIFAFWLFYGMTVAAVFVFRRREPDAPRPYRTWGYPVVPAIFVLLTIYLIFFTIKDAPVQSLIGLVLIVAGLPFYWYFVGNYRKLKLALSALVGFLLGGWVGFLLRPSEPNLGQLSFTTVIRRSGSTGVADALAQTSFNYMAAGAAIGIAIALILAFISFKRKQ